MADAAPLCLSQGLDGLVEDLVEEHGEEAVRRALMLTPLLGDLRSRSQWALTAGVDAFRQGVPTALIIKTDPATKTRGERVDVCLLTGDSHQLVLDFS